MLYQAVLNYMLKNNIYDIRIGVPMQKDYEQITVNIE